MSFFGQGAGRYPTAYNVLQDCMDITLGKGFYSPYDGTVTAVNTEKMRYYVSGCTDSYVQDNTAEVWGDAVVTKPVSVEDMHNWLKDKEGVFAAALAD